MTVIEVIYLVAATLWILVVVGAVAVGGRYLLKLRARRRRVTRLLDSVRLSAERVTGPYRAIAGGSVTLFQRWAGASGPARRPALSAARGRR